MDFIRGYDEISRVYNELAVRTLDKVAKKYGFSETKKTRNKKEMSSAFEFSYNPFPPVFQVAYGGLMLSYLGPLFRKEADVDADDVRRRILIGFASYECVAMICGIFLMVNFRAKIFAIITEAEPRQFFENILTTGMAWFAVLLTVPVLTLVYLNGPLEKENWRRKALIVLSWLRVLSGLTVHPLRREWWIPQLAF